MYREMDLRFWQKGGGGETRLTYKEATMAGAGQPSRPSGLFGAWNAHDADAFTKRSDAD